MSGATLRGVYRANPLCEICRRRLNDRDERVFLANGRGVLHKACSTNSSTVTPVYTFGVDPNSATFRTKNVFLSYIAAAFLLLTGAYLMNSGLTTSKEVSTIGKIAQKFVGKEIMLPWELSTVFSGAVSLALGVAAMAAGLVIFSMTLKK
jgi:hypothetical protein